MSIFRSEGPFPSKAEQMSRDRDEEEAQKRKKRKVAYQGRSWAEAKKELPVQPRTLPSENRNRREVYANQAMLERAEKIISRMISIEEKIAQLSFFQTEASYNHEVQLEIERHIQKWSLGGLLFTKGEFRRQSYLVERYQELSATPLLIGNDFLHGLSFYFQGEIPLASLENMDERKSSDLGKAVVFQNRRLGVHFQFDRELKHLNDKGQILLNDAQARAFRNGIREAQGIVGKERARGQMFSQVAPQVPFIVPQSHTDQIQEVYALRTINFLDLTQMGGESIEQKICEMHHASFDAFLLKDNVMDVLQAISQGIKKGILKESDVDKRLLKVLILKLTLFQKLYS